MLPSNYGFENRIDCNGELLRDIEEISKALYLHKHTSTSLKSSAHVRSQSIDQNQVRDSKSKSKTDDDSSQKGKRSSVWQWKPPKLKSLSHLWHRKYSCCFFCHVHSIEDLPIDFNDVSLSVHWKRKDHVMRTLPSNVTDGIVGFEETLMNKCSIYGVKSGSENLVRYKPKLCLLYASIVGASMVDLGKHWIDLTRLLPLTFEELEDNKSSGKWTTGINLAGKAKGATMQVSFGYMVVKDELDGLGGDMNCFPSINSKQNRSRESEYVAGFGSRKSDVMLRRASSVPSGVTRDSTNSSQSSDSNNLHEVCSNHGSEFSNSINLLHQKLDEGRDMSGLGGDFDFVFQHLKSVESIPNSLLDSGNNSNRTEHDDSVDFTVVNKGIEFEYSSEKLRKYDESAAQDLDISAVEIIDVAEIFKDEGLASDQEMQLDDKAEISGCRLPSVFLEEEISCSCSIGSKVAELGFKDGINNVAEISKDDGLTFNPETKLVEIADISGSTPSVFVEDKHSWFCTTESNAEKLEFEFHEMLISEPAGPEDIMVKGNKLHKEKLREEVNVNHNKPSMISRSSSLDDVTKAIADDFCNLLQDNRTDSEDESPKERLWREFEDEMLASGGSLLFSLGQKVEEEAASTYAAPANISLESIIEDFNMEAQQLKDDYPCPVISKAKARKLERLETQSLMEEWGLNDDTFASSPSTNSMGGFGSPISVEPEEPIDLPSIGEGLGAFLQIKGGGFLRSMSTSLFRNAKNDVALIMQASQPLVLPPEMGSSIVEILQCMASVGPERLSEKVHTLMALEDVSGKLIQQLAWDSSSRTDGPNRRDFWRHGSSFSLDPRGSSYASIEELVAVAMDKIEVLSIEGLRIQSGMPGMMAHSSISLDSVGEAAYPVVEDVAMGSQVSDILNVETLMDHSVSLDEWLRMMDAGISSNGDQVIEHLSKILASNCAQPCYFDSTDLGGYQERDNDQEVFWGNSLTIAFTMQLRDPFRNYEPVGGPMLALVQVERSFGPSSSAPICSQPELTCKIEDMPKLEEIVDCVVKDGISVEDGISRYKMKEVHVAGMITEEEIWASRRQQQSGSRWLLASNMNKVCKVQLSKSTAMILHPMVTRKQKPENYLWSISCNAKEDGTESGKLNDPYMRNPDIIFPR